MELGIFFAVAIIGFGSLLLYKILRYSNGVKAGDKDRNYYYNRFMRNKEQVERYIESLQHTITIFNCGEERFGTLDNISANQHLSNLKMDYQNDYTEITQKILKRNKLTRKDKKLYMKLLSKQSEKLYNVEKILRELNVRYKN